jgi:saccharopepsin
MMDKNLVDNGMFSFYLSREDPKSSELVLGGYNPDHFTGEIEWLPVVRKGYWEVALDSISFGDSKINVNKATAVVDTGILS